MPQKKAHSLFNICAQIIGQIIIHRLNYTHSKIEKPFCQQQKT